jgi:hypothetical protein
MASAWHLEAGDRIRIVREFRDFDGRTVESGQDLLLTKKEFFPHDGGMTLSFEGGLIVRLCENEAADEIVMVNAEQAFFVKI